MSSPFIDVHAHFLPSFYRDALQEAGYVPGPAGMAGIPEWSVENHLAFMQENNISKSYLSISTPGSFLIAPVAGDTSSKPVDAARALTRKINEDGAQLKREYPTKFGYFASLPLPDIQATLDEIDYVAAHLDADGFVVMSNAFGMYLGDPRLAPVYAKLNALNAIVFAHPTTPCTPGHAATSPQSLVDPPTALAANMPLSDSYAGPLLEFLFDSTRAFCDILLTQTATDYPRIRWIVPHCGAVLPSVLDRVIRFSGALHPRPGSTRSVAPLSTERVREIIGGHFFFDLAGLPMNGQIHHLLRWVDHSRFLYGSDVPFTSWALAGALAGEVRDELPRIFGMETGVHECMQICHGNAEKLFGGTSKP